MAKNATKWLPKTPGSVTAGNASRARLQENAIVRLQENGIARIYEDNAVVAKEATTWTGN